MQGNVRRDPMAMLPFCGYHMGDYLAHWLEIEQQTTPERLPGLFSVNWFRKGSDGKYLWPGFGQNARVLKWIFERIQARERGGLQSGTQPSPIGLLPANDALDLTNLNIQPAALAELLEVDEAAWRTEAAGIRASQAQFGEHLPPELAQELAALEARLNE